MDAPEPIAPFFLCVTSDDVAKAVDELAQSDYLILDCEGKDLGRQNGALSLISAGTGRGKIHLIDALSLDRSSSATWRFFDLLKHQQPRKIVWDGRMDFIELWSAYGISLGGVIDLQIAEMISRTRSRGEGEN
jgi:exonuclease 3'-5' domain-containing protein 1